MSMSVGLGASIAPFEQTFAKALLPHLVLGAALNLFVAPLSFAQPASEAPCEVLKNRFGSQKDWWKAASQWAEVKPAPIVSELAGGRPCKSQRKCMATPTISLNNPTLSSVTLPSVVVQRTRAASPAFPATAFIEPTLAGANGRSGARRRTPSYAPKKRAPLPLLAVDENVGVNR